MATGSQEQAKGRLRRELRFWEAVALSLGIMAPTAAMALNGVAPAGLIGRAVPLAFFFAAVAIALISYAFVRLTRYFSHAGSTYALAGATLGPRAGFFAGWALLGTYTAFTAASTAQVGLFGGAFLSGTGIWDRPEWLVLSLVAAALIWLIAYGDIKVATRFLLSVEGISVLLIVILVVVIFSQVIGGTAPNGQEFTLEPFVPAADITIGAVAFASVFGLLSFGGFEGAAVLGEETNNPRRNIPLAIAAAVGFAGVFYTLVMLAQSLGFGIDAAGVKAFATSSSPLGDLSTDYVGSAMANAINLGAMISAFASALGTATGASRILFALGRDGFITRRLGVASARTGAPAHALAVIMVIALCVIIGFRINGTDNTNVFFYMGTLGVLSMLVAYVVIQFGAARFLYLGRRESRWGIVIIGLALCAIGYTLYKQVWPRPPSPYDVFPYIVGAWALVGVAITVAFPAFTRRMGIGLSEAEGIRTKAGD